MSVAFKVTTVEIFILYIILLSLLLLLLYCTFSIIKNRILLLYFIVKKLTHKAYTIYNFTRIVEGKSWAKKITSTGKSHALL